MRIDAAARNATSDAMLRSPERLRFTSAAAPFGTAGVDADVSPGAASRSLGILSSPCNGMGLSLMGVSRTANSLPGRNARRHLQRAATRTDRGARAADGYVSSL